MHSQLNHFLLNFAILSFSVVGKSALLDNDPFESYLRISQTGHFKANSACYHLKDGCLSSGVFGKTFNTSLVLKALCDLNLQ